MEVKLLPEARDELQAMPVHERRAMVNAFRKLAAGGDRLRYPHSSAVKGVSVTLRELRPRMGHSPWRAFYRRVGTELVVASIGPEAGVDPRGFERAVSCAIERLAA